MAHPDMKDEAPLPGLDMGGATTPWYCAVEDLIFKQPRSLSYMESVESNAVAPPSASSSRYYSTKRILLQVATMLAVSRSRTPRGEFTYITISNGDGSKGAIKLDCICANTAYTKCRRNLLLDERNNQ